MDDLQTANELTKMAKEVIAMRGGPFDMDVHSSRDSVDFIFYFASGVSYKETQKRMAKIMKMVEGMLEGSGWDAGRDMVNSPGQASFRIRKSGWSADYVETQVRKLMGIR